MVDLTDYQGIVIVYPYRDFLELFFCICMSVCSSVCPKVCPIDNLTLDLARRFGHDQALLLILLTTKSSSYLDEISVFGHFNENAPKFFTHTLPRKHHILIRVRKLHIVSKKFCSRTVLISGPIA